MPSDKKKRKPIQFKDVVMDDHGDIAPKKKGAAGKKTVAGWNKATAALSRRQSEAARKRFPTKKTPTT